MNLNKFSQERPVHLLTFPLFFVFNHFFTIATPIDSENLDRPIAWIFNFLIGVAICAAIPIMLNLLLRKWFDEIKSGLLATLTCFLFFFFQDLLVAISELRSMGIRGRWTLSTIALLFTLLYLYIGTTRKSLLAFNQFLSILSTAFILYTAGVLITKFGSLLPRKANFVTNEVKINCNSCPDIYLILLDSYTSNKSLKEYLHFNNQAFKDSLKKFDFKVTDSLTSGYAETIYSMSATFDFNLHDLTNVTYGLDRLIKNGAVIRSLTSAKYEIQNLAFFEVGDQPRHYGYSPAYPFSFINGIMKSSILNFLISSFWQDLKFYEIHKDVLSRTADPVSAKSSRPKFVYTHVLAPHPPYVMDSTGRSISMLFADWSNPTAYVNQVKGLNKMVLKTVNQIMQISSNPIIIIMGDHGYRYLSDPTDDKIESYTAFLAYRGPNQDKLDSLSKTNDIFRLVFEGLK